jgi:hypothetical protein
MDVKSLCVLEYIKYKKLHAEYHILSFVGERGINENIYAYIYTYRSSQKDT